ncbi:hypothetical protein KOAAANKH_03531 [Brevundimonas sp. NIBR10]|uniref:hypothetical protein n=1 Tax=Brevundimonas sp. NIBR10 TaxID=3015997 RepID=UPI0022F16855|nr:hypothetical protein [Brevundimonas sp. NIBR10]WGM48628.1 hypothetical protein KOAAANKH_03531 [Brevundimonas sp. NIBR10]
MTINAALFAQAGEALFGLEWKQSLADLIEMDVRRVRRIAKAAREGLDYPVNESLGPVLAGHLKERARSAQAQSIEAERLAKLLE